MTGATVGSRWWPAEVDAVPGWGGRPGAGPVLAAATGFAFFVVNAVLLDLSSDSPWVASAIAVLDLVLVLRMAHGTRIAVALPAGVLCVVALDWHAIPPTHRDVLPDPANAAVLLCYLAIGVLLGQVAARVTGRAQRSEAERAALAEEHAALRRVATSVARQDDPSSLFLTVAREAQQLLGVESVALLRGPDGHEAVLAQAGPGSSAPVRALADAAAPSLADPPTVSAPVTVDNTVWGRLVAHPGADPSRRTELAHRLAEFGELVGMAIANADSKAELEASRARVVAQADETRKQLERDLHDGVQQRLVSLALHLRLARDQVDADPDAATTGLAWVQTELGGVLEDLRELSHGIHPAVLTAGGLGPALATLARRAPLPVDADVSDLPALPEGLEVGTYYLVAEALTNAIKHARATRVVVAVTVEEAPSGPTLVVSVVDDGVGGAATANGSGLLGLRDRVEALGGRLEVHSPPGSGTTLVARLPLPQRV